MMGERMIAETDGTSLFYGEPKEACVEILK
jgi:hypothetical protein